MSRSETEWAAFAETVNMVLFVVQLLKSMKILVKLPVMVRVEKIRTIFTAGNIATTGHIKHVDIRYMHVNKYVKDGIMKC